MPDGSILSSSTTARVVVKSTAAPSPTGDPLEFVMSDETVDRYGDVIAADGWQLGNFRKNPIALFGHSNNFPIGNWRNVRVEGTRLLGRLELMPAVSERLQEIHTAIEHKVLRAVSVGFIPTAEPEPVGSGMGLRFPKSELVECSLVAVPANPNAVQLAKALNLSPETMGMIFGETAVRDHTIRRGFIGGPADTSRTRSNNVNLSELIQASENRLNGLKDGLNSHIALHGASLDQDGLRAMDEFNTQIDEETGRLEGLRRTERSLGAQSEAAGNGTGTALVPSGANTGFVGGTGAAGAGRRGIPSFALPKRKEPAPADYVFRAATVSVLAHITKQPQEVVLRQYYGDDEATRIVSGVLLRAASVPATTTLTGWAAELVQTAVLDFLDVLVPDSIYRGLAARGPRFTFGRNGVVSLPARASTPTIAGSFVAEGAAIPVRQAAFASVSLTPKKMGVISTFTREIAEHSTPAIEGLIRQIMQEDTSVSLDSVLLDATAASATRPAGLRNGVAATTAATTGATNVEALTDDIVALISVLAAVNALRDPVFIMNPVDKIRASLLTNGDGEFPFRTELAQNVLAGIPVLTSTTVTARMLILVDAADFFSATGDEPLFAVSDQAVLHMEDTTPGPIVSGGTAASGAVRSLFQTDSLAIRMILPVNWAMRRTGVVAWTSSVVW